MTLMLRRLFLLLFVLAVVGLGIKVGRSGPKSIQLISAHPETDFPLTEYKSFALVVYACNQAAWCERTLSSIFEQDYEAYRVVVIDDASVDGTFEKIKTFIVDNHQEHRVTLLKNEERIGPVDSLARAIATCLDKEIVIPIDAKDWFVQPSLLKQLNGAYQNPDVWMTQAQAILYPSYERTQLKQAITFYASLFKQLGLVEHVRNKEAYLTPLLGIVEGHLRTLPEPLFFSNCAACSK